MMTSYWSLTSHKNVKIVDWERNYSVYNYVTGETHLLNAFPVEIIKVLAEQAESSSMIAKKLAGLCGDDYTVELQLRVDLVLKDLESIELVELLS